MRQSLEAKLLAAMQTERVSALRIAKATTRLLEAQRTRARIEKQIGRAEVQRIVNSDEAVREITQKKNTVRKTVNALNGGHSK